MVALSFAGCAEPGDGAAAPGGPAVPSGSADASLEEADGLGRVNYTSPYVGGEARSRRIEATHTPTPGECPPALCIAPFWHDVSELFVEGQLLQVRVVLNWTNDATNSATMAIATDVPYHMDSIWFHDTAGFMQGTDAGTYTQTIVFETGAFEWWEGPYLLGVAVRQYAVAQGVPYTLDVTVAPIDRGAGMFQFYDVTIPDGATVTAELVAPLAPADGAADLLFFDASERPVAHVGVAGPDGAATAVELEPGEYVMYVARVEGGYPRLHAEAASGNLSLLLLEDEWTTVEVVDVVQAKGTGSADLATETRTGGVWIWLDPHYVADAAGPYAATEAFMRLSSSNGLVRETLLVGEYGYYSDAFTCGCISLNVPASQYRPENWLDDDGTLTVTYDATGTTGTIIAATQRYVK